jgi:hypothetical protein
MTAKHTIATKEKTVSNIRIAPIVAIDPGHVRPIWGTHVCWYNK